MDRTAKAIENHKNIILSTNSTIASIGLEKAGQKVAGVLVTPAVWVLNYSAQGSTPDKIDVGLYVTGFFGTLASAGTITTSLVKAVVDDDIDTKLREIQSGEEPKYRPFIKPCYRYGMSAPQINAMSIANKGGTAWKHPNGLWVYITDINGYLVNNFKPKKAVVVYRPNLPLKKNRTGGFSWGITR